MYALSMKDRKFHVVRIANTEPATVDIIRSFENEADAHSMASAEPREFETENFDYIVMDDESLEEARRQLEIDQGE